MCITGQSAYILYRYGTSHRRPRFHCIYAYFILLIYTYTRPSELVQLHGHQLTLPAYIPTVQISTSNSFTILKKMLPIILYRPDAHVHLSTCTLVSHSHILFSLTCRVKMEGKAVWLCETTYTCPFVCVNIQSPFCYY